MQPYIFPYLGYFQLIYSVDKFVFYDDVNFIKQGWINRNKILINKQESLFAIPIKNASSFNLIKETELHPILFKKWRGKFLKSIKQSYSKAPFFTSTYSLIEKVFEEENNISNLAMISITAVIDYLNIKKNFFISSKDFKESVNLDRADRLISISQKLNADTYINMLGGKKLYDEIYFKKNGIDLLFLEPVIEKYNQENESFISHLSIIDVLMNNNKETIKEHLKMFKIN